MTIVCLPFLRNPKIAEDVTKEIGNVHYNIDKSLESLSEAEIQKAFINNIR
jgi:hypothetical protein